MSATRTETVVSHWIGGEPVRGGSQMLPITDPARGETIREVQLATTETVDTAVQTALEAGRQWGELSIARRSAIMRRWSVLIDSHREDFIRLMGEEHGKVRSDAAGEVDRALEALDFAAGAAAVLTKGEFSDQVSSGIDVHTLRRPLGVCVAITPFNFPVMIPLWLTSAALMCGNTVVVKPSEQDPSCSILLARLAGEAGLPPGVFNVVQGDRNAVENLLDHPDVAAVGFVGSTPIARLVSERARAKGKRVQAFGGAKNHMIVMPDADLDTAANAAAAAAYGSTGQRCMAISVLAVPHAVADACVEQILARVSALRTGPASDEGSDIGPLISAAAQQRVVEHIAGADAAGATLRADGRDQGGDGYFVGPTLVDDVDRSMAIYREEVFGPVLSVVRVEGLDEAIELTNSNPFGNGAAIFTNSGGAAREFCRRATAGMIGVNVAIPVPAAEHSFGGWKDSRFADVHMAGPEAFGFFTQGKIVTSRWPAPDRSSRVDYSFPGQ